MALLERTPKFTLQAALNARASSDPGAPYLLFRDRVFSYAEVEDQADSLAAALHGLGIGKGDRVALVMPPWPEFVVSLFAVAKLGAVAVPLNPRLTPPELQYMLRHSEAAAAVTVETFHGTDYLQLFEDMLPVLPELQYLITVGEEDLWYDDRVFQFEDLLSAGVGREYPSPEANPERDVVALLYTSGTTGKPKGVELTHTNLLHAAGGTARALGLTPDDRVFGITALFHVFGLGPGLLGTLLSGSSLVLQEEFEPGPALDLIQTHGVTVHYGVPTLFMRELLEHQETPRDISSLRLGLVAGAPVSDGFLHRMEEQFCPEMRVGYSLTETSSTLAMTTGGDSPEKRYQTVGKALEGMEIRVLEEDRTELPVESLGEIAVRGPSVMRGYYRQPGETRNAFTEEGYFLTGDLGMVDEAGYLHLVSRSKEVIIRSGVNVFPREVEDRILAHPAVREVAVVGVPDEVLGEVVAAAVVPIEGAIVTGGEIQAWCRVTLTEHKVPDLVRFLDRLPLTGSGKVRKVELIRLLAHQPSGNSSP